MLSCSVASSARRERASLQASESGGKIYILVRIQKREKFILQGNLQSLGKKCGILTAVYLLITGYLVGAASTGKRNDSTFAGAYKIRINNAVIRGKLDVFGGTIAVTDSSQISLADVGNIQYQR